MGRIIKEMASVGFVVCLLFACSSRPGDDSAEKGAEPPKSTSEDAQKGPTTASEEKAVFKGPGEMLPKAVEGFEIASKPRYFGPDNLYDLINGGAEIYAEYGLKEMVTIDYKSKARTGITVTVEVYDQGSLLGAFGRMTRFLAGRTDLTGIGEGLPENLVEKGMFGGTDLVYYKNRYLVHVTLLDESPSATAESMTKVSKEVLPGFAAAVAKKIETDPDLPKEYELFPKENRIERSNAWDAQRLAGIDGLGAGFSYRYSDGKANWTLFATRIIRNAQTLGAEQTDKSSKKEGAKTAGFEVAGNRVVGFKTFDENWTPEQLKKVEKQVSDFAIVMEQAK